MATVTAGVATPELLEEHWHETPGLGSFLTTVDHKRIGKRYLYTGLLFLVIGGLESLVLGSSWPSPTSTSSTPRRTTSCSRCTASR